MLGGCNKAARILQAVGPFLLFLATAALHWPARHFEFIEVYDDKAYVTENPAVRNGLSWQGARWAFTSFHASNWHPLTWLSHMADCEVWGLKAGGHHLTNILLHAANAALVFAVLRRLTGAFWGAVVVAVLFAWHPLRVQSVAWVAERKDVLSGFFFLLTLGAYARYAEGFTLRGATPGDNPKSGAWGFLRSSHYWWAVLSYALGLMSKPMLVTVPFLLWLLDFWPLRRLTPFHGRVLAEKVPFFTLSAASGLVTLLAQKSGGSVASLELLPFWMRVQNAVVAYARYLGKVFCPGDLAVIYPYVEDWPIEAVAGSALLLGVISWAAVRLARRMPYFPVGWFWFVGMLVPVIGLVQVGEQSIADRYTYLPSIGLLLAVSWSLAGLLGRWRSGRAALAFSAAMLAVLWAAQTRHELQFWRDNLSLFQRAVEVSPNSSTAHKNLGEALARLGRWEEALGRYETALNLNPADPAVYSDIGTTLARLGRTDEAVQRLQTAMNLDPKDADFPFNLGNALAELGRTDAAIEAYQRALQLNPNHGRARNNLAIALAHQGRTEEALREAQHALVVEPRNPEIHNTVANLLSVRGQHEQALQHYLEALRLDPQFARANFNMGVALLQLGRTNDGVAQLVKAATLDRKYWQPRARLGAHFSALERWDEALTWWRETAELQTNHAEAWFNLGKALFHLDRLVEATNALCRAVALQPQLAEARLLIGSSLMRLGQPGEAARQFRLTLSVNTNHPLAHLGLGQALYRTGHVRDAVEHFRTAIRLQPNMPEALNDAAWVLATAADPAVRNPQEALEHARRANLLAPVPRPNFLGTLAAACAAAGRFDEAIAVAEQAIALAEEAGMRAFADKTRARLERYRAGISLVEQPSASAP